MALTYQIALINVWWRNGEQNNRYFSTLAEQKTYFDSLIIGWSELVNFNINDNISTTIYFRDKTNRTIDTLLKCNYAIIKNPNGNYRYFFVNRIWQDSSNQVGVDLELDDFQSNLLPNQDDLQNLYVKRITNPTAFLTTSNTYKYNLNYPSLVKPIDMYPAKRNISSQKAFMKFTDNVNLDTWLNENIAYWKYLFMDKNQIYYGEYDNQTNVDKAYNTSNEKLNSESVNIFTGDAYNIMDYGCIIQPIYLTSKRIYIHYTDNNSISKYFILNEDGIYNLFNQLEGLPGGQGTSVKNGAIGTYGFGFKMSIMPPLLKKNLIEGTDFSIDGNGDLIFEGGLSLNNPTKVLINLFGGQTHCARCYVDVNCTGQNKNDAYQGVFVGCNIDYTTIDIEFHNPITMTLGSYIGGTRLLGQEFRSFRLRLGSNSFEYDPIKYLDSNTTSKIYGKYTEIVSLGLSKMYARLNESNVYTSAMENDFTGVVASLDMILPTLTNEWSTFIANNKNYYLQKDWTLGMNFFKGYESASIGALQSKSASEGIGTFAKGMLDIGIDYLDTKTTMGYREDDLKNAPQSIANANGDPFFMYDVTGYQPILDLMEAPQDYLDSCNQSLELAGIPFNDKGSFTDFVNKHTCFDYIEGNIISYNTNINLSQKEKDRLQLLFAKGIRLFYVDNYNFNTTINLEVQ